MTLTLKKGCYHWLPLAVEKKKKNTHCRCEHRTHSFSRKTLKEQSIWFAGLTIDGYVARRTRDTDQSDGIQARLCRKGQSCGQRFKLHSRSQQTLNNRERIDQNPGMSTEFDKDGSKEKWNQNDAYVCMYINTPIHTYVHIFGLIDNLHDVHDHFVTACVNYSHWSSDCFSSNQTDKAVQISEPLHSPSNSVSAPSESAARVQCRASLLLFVIHQPNTLVMSYRLNLGRTFPWNKWLPTAYGHWSRVRCRKDGKHNWQSTNGGRRNIWTHSTKSS